jgi:DNA-binding beta-propeller fold protein YncE
MRRITCMILPVVIFCLMTSIGRVEAKELIFTQGYNAVEAIDTDTDEIVAYIPVDGFTREIVWTEDKKTMYLTTKRHNIVKIDLQQMKVVKTFDANWDGWKRNIWGFVLSDDNKTAYINSIDRKVEGGDVLVRQTISQIDLEDGRVLRSMTPPWGVAGLVYQKDGKALFAVGLDIYKIDIAQNEMKIVDTYPMFDKKKNILPIWPSTQENGGIFLSNYYTPEFMGLLSINAATGEIVDRQIKGPPVMAYSFIFSTDKKKAYGIMEDLTVIDLETNSIIKTLPNTEGTSYSVMPTSDGKKLYVGAGGSTIMVYDAETMKVLKVLQMQADSVALNRISF